MPFDISETATKVVRICDMETHLCILPGVPLSCNYTRTEHRHCAGSRLFATPTKDQQNRPAIQVAECRDPLRVSLLKTTNNIRLGDMPVDDVRLGGCGARQARHAMLGKSQLRKRSIELARFESSAV